jgi:hypothetical protein
MTGSCFAKNVQLKSADDSLPEHNNYFLDYYPGKTIHSGYITVISIGLG